MKYGMIRAKYRLVKDDR